MLQKRRGYSPEEIAGRSRQICRRFFAYFPVSKFRHIHLFLPITSQNEVDTWLIVKHVRAHFPTVKMVVPVIQRATETLTHYLLTPETKLVLNHWQVPEPHGAEPIAEAALDMVLVPLLGFDEQGHRVGYGKGYYDRFLALCRPDAVTVGLSLEEPVPRIADVHAADVSLQFAVTPAHVYRFI